MSTNVGAVDFDLLLNSNPFNKGLKNASTQIKNSGIQSSLKSIGKIILAAFSVKAIVNFGKECINLGSDLAEVQNVVDVTFGNLNTEVNKFAENAIEQFGLGQTVTKKYVGTFGAMAKAFNFSNKEALAMSETLTGLAGDVASFYNLSTDEAYTKLKSVFTGETETLKDLGVVMTQNALDQYALANGYGKTTAKMSEQEKVALRYKFVLDKLSIANGDFARTSDSWANQTRVLSLRFNELKATLGQGFINIFTPIVKGINWVIGKLQVLANVFKSFTEMIFGSAGGSDGSANIVSDLVTNATNASDAVGGIGDSAKKTAKDLKSLAAFDTAQVLKSNDDDSGSGSGGGAGSGFGGLDIGDSTNSLMQQANSQMDAFIEKAKELASIFKKGFDASFGNTNFDGIVKHLSSIKDIIIDIWTSPEVLNSVQRWIETCLYALGQVTGAIARIGVNITEFLVGSIDTYLLKNTDRIKTHICKMFDISSENIALAGNLFQALGEISDVFSGDTAKQIGANIIAMFANPFMSVSEVLSKFIKDISGISIQPIIDNAEKIKVAFESTFITVEKITALLAEAMTYIGDKWNEVYDTYISPLMESLKTGISDTFGKFLDVYNQYIAPFFNNMASGIETLWNEHLKPLVDKTNELIGSIVSAIQVLWENWLKPLIDWIVENIIPVLVPIFNSIWNTICNVFGSIADTLSGTIDSFKGVIDFIVGVFTGDWNKTWEGIKTFFSGIWDTMKGIVDITWNTIKGIIETAIIMVMSKIQVTLMAIKTTWENIWNGIKTTVSNIFNSIKVTISDVFNSIMNTASSIWSNITTNITNAVTNIKNGIVNAFQTAYNMVTSIFNNIGSFFSGIWNNIQSTFSDLGTKIGDAISGAVKSGINGVLGMIENTVNKFVNMINGAIDVINAIPGVNISKLKTLSIPRLAEGGYVKANTPQLAMIGDNRHQGEVVAPEDKLMDLYKKANQEMGLGNNQKVIELLENIIQILINLSFDFNLYIDSYELNKRLEKIKNKNKFATNGG